MNETDKPNPGWGPEGGGGHESIPRVSGQGWLDHYLVSQQPWEQMRFLEHSDVHAEQASGRKQTQTRLVLGITA